MACCFMEPKGDAAVRCSAVPVKGSSNELSAKRTNALFVESGLDGLDQETHSSQEFQRGVRCGIADFPWCGLKGVQTAEGQIRVVSDSLGTRVNLQVPSDHTIQAWLVEFGVQSVGTLSGVLKTWTVQRKVHGQESRT